MNDRLKPQMLRIGCIQGRMLRRFGINKYKVVSQATSKHRSPYGEHNTVSWALRVFPIGFPFEFYIQQTLFYEDIPRVECSFNVHYTCIYSTYVRHDNVTCVLGIIRLFEFFARQVQSIQVRTFIEYCIFITILIEKRYTQIHVCIYTLEFIFILIPSCVSFFFLNFDFQSMIWNTLLD